jgi:hypothetical protein
LEGKWHSKRECMPCHMTEKSEAIACARRCRSSPLTGWWIQKE